MKFYIDAPSKMSNSLRNCYEKIKKNGFLVSLNLTSPDFNDRLYQTHLHRKMVAVIDSDCFIHHSEYEGYKHLFLLGSAISKNIVKGSPNIYVTGNKEVIEYSHPLIKRIEGFCLETCLDKILEDISKNNK